MKNSISCNEIQNNIYCFNTLSINQKNEILKHIKLCIGCRSHFQKISHIINLMDNHVNDQLLISYAYLILHPEDTTSDRKKLSDDEIDKIKQHMQKCEFCNSKYLEIQSQYLEMEEFWLKAGYPDFEIQPINNKQDLSTKNRQNSFILSDKRYLGSRNIQKIIAIAAVILVLFMSFLADRKGTSLEDLAKIEDIHIPVSIRGGESNTLYKGILVFNQKKYNKAIVFLHEYIEANPNTNNENYARYIIALSYLKSMDNNNTINLLNVDKGISELKIVLSLSKSQNQKENAYWYLAKAYLMKKDIPHAIQYFKEVEALSGDRLKESQVILKQLIEKQK